MRIYMQQHAPGEPLRFYQLQLQADLLGGWTLVRESGIQGQRGQVRQEYFAEREPAEGALMRFRDRQLRRGYRVVFREGAHLEEG
jgi:predicted DNA-binding WGR domain protein